MSLLVAPFLVALAQVPDPRTVNDQSLGKPEDFESRGPAKVCMREMALQASAGETIYLRYAGIHSGSLTLVTGSGTTEFSHGEIWAKPKAKSKLFESSDRVRIFRTKREGKIAYLVWVLTPGYDEKPVWMPRIWVSGQSLNGNDADREILSRLKIELNGQKDCDRTYAYGWGMLFGDEPLSKKKNQ